MAILSITIADDKIPRIQAAYGHLDSVVGSPTFGQWVNGTVADVTATLKASIKAKVIDYETSLAATADRATRSAEVY